MYALATNQRTTKSATIKRASRVARRNMNRLDASALKDVEQLYRTSAADIALAIQGYAGIDGNLRLQNLQDIQQQVNGILSQIGNARKALLDNNLEKAARLGAEVYTGYVDANTLVRVSDEAVRFVNSFMGKDGLQLSDRIWRIDNHAREAMGNAIENAIIQGYSASEAATNFLNNDLPVPGDIANKINNANAFNVARTASNELLRGAGSPRYNALRLFRTELNRAHGEAYMSSGEEDEDFAGWRYLLSPRHPEPDICDMHAKVNRYGLGAGVYPSRSKTPWPAHPNTLSYVEIVFVDELTDEDKAAKIDRIAWLKQQPYNVQKGVLGARQKVAALRKGILRESEIATPWRVLNKKYAAKGISAESLRVSPPAVEVVTHTDEAINYVVDKGLRTGNEHLVAFDQANGKELIKKTSHAVNYVEFSLQEITMLRRGNRSIELIHNHPSSSSLSFADLKIGGLPGTSVITAAGHDGALFHAKVGSNYATMVDIEDIIHNAVHDTGWAQIRAGNITTSQAGRLHSHIQNIVLHRLGYINYEAVFKDGIVGQMINDIGSNTLEKMVLDVEKLFNEAL